MSSKRKLFNSLIDNVNLYNRILELEMLSEETKRKVEEHLTKTEDLLTEVIEMNGGVIL